jgi:CubicO group peptidase (beta-lactamase class C family)
MKKTSKLVLRMILWGALIVLLLFAAKVVFLSLRYSKEFMVREYFMDMGDTDDYLTLPARELASSPDPFQFAVDTSKEMLVQETFQSDTKIKDLDTFLEDTGTWAFLVIQNDTILYERYFKGHQHDSLLTSFSVAKSFNSALIGIAIEEGYIKSVNDPITDYIPELAERDPRFRDIQIRHLLMMASGLRYEDHPLFRAPDHSLTYEFEDLRHLILTETEVMEQPGTTFVYNDYNPLLLGLILERATGRPVTTYLQEKIWDPIGMEYGGSWSLDSEESGFEKMESSINARAVDYAKFGRLYLNGGNWNGTQVVPAAWVAASTQDNGMIEDAPIYYGYLWWGENCNPDSQDFLAVGNFGQFIYVSPAKDLIIVRNGEEYGVESSGEEWVVWADAFCKFAMALP